MVAFDKANYWKNRKKKVRGQGLPIEGKFYAKGEKVTVEKYDGKTKTFKEVEMLNAPGSHMARVDGKIQRVNRRVAHNKMRSHPATKKNFAYQQDKGFEHSVGERDIRPTHPPSLTNHMRHRQRQIEREMKKQKEKEDVQPLQKKA